MQRRKIAKTSLEVSILGLGTVKFGRNEGMKYPTTYSLPTDKEIDELLCLAADLGINLLDTAPAYGTSETRLGKLLKNKRHEWVISTKVGEEFVNGKSYFDFSAKNIQQSVERSLKRLNTDYLDIVLVHSNGDDAEILANDHTLTTLQSLKESGKIRAYGISTKTVAGGLLAVDCADIVMLTYHPAYTQEREVIEYAWQKQTGVFVKKGFASGHLSQLGSQDPIKNALKFIFAQMGVTSLILGTINLEHLRENVEKLGC